MDTQAGNGCWERVQLALAVALILIVVVEFTVIIVSSMFYRFPG